VAGAEVEKDFEVAGGGFQGFVGFFGGRRCGGGCKRNAAGSYFLGDAYWPFFSPFAEILASSVCQVG
jgi:hypothetical protein